MIADHALVAPELPRPEQRTTLWYLAASIVCLVAGLAPLFVVRYLPMVDVPEHAYQIYVWMHRGELPYSRLYEANWFTPYLLGYAITRGFAALLGIRIALKVVVALTTVALFLSTDLLLRWTRGPRWFALLSIPLAYGYSFYWGFLNYLVAAPLVVLVVALALRRASRPTRTNAVLLAITGIALFFAHVLALGAGGLAALGAVLFSRRFDLRHAIRTLLPLAAALPVMLAWTGLTYFGPHPPNANSGIEWYAPFLGHALQLPNVLLGTGPDRPASRFVIALVLALALLGVRPRRRPALLAAAAVAIALWLSFPDVFGGATFLRDRFAIFVGVFSLAALGFPRTARRRQAVIALIVGAVLAWSGVLTYRFGLFDRETRGLDRLIAQIPPGQSVLKLVFAPRGFELPGNPKVFQHLPVWYNAEKGGLPGYDFARYSHLLFRYPTLPNASVSSDTDWMPGSGRMLWTKKASQYPYVIVRTEEGDDVQLAMHALLPARLVASSGDWLLFARTVKPRLLATGDVHVRTDAVRPRTGDPEGTR